jgi:nucleoside-diphosphate-sugar epimerase
MKIALTGASGFLGQHVLNELLLQEIEVTAVTRNATRLADFKERIHIVEMDISKPQIDCYQQMGCPEILMHLAWDGLPNYRALHHFENELPGQYQFLRTMIKSGLSSLMVTGTCFEYGMQSGPLGEDMSAKPTNPYGFAKNALRQQLEFLQSDMDFSLTWARLFYMYGEGQSANSLFPKLKEAILRQDIRFEMSGGDQLRDYLPVEEVARLLVQLVIAEQGIGIINVCSGVPISVRKLVEQLLVENNWKIDLNLGSYPYPDYEPMEFWGNRELLDKVMEKNELS